MTIEKSSVLRELAERFKGKLSKCTVYDANVCRTRTEPNRPWELIPVSGEPFFLQFRFAHRERKVTLYENSTYVHGTVNGVFGYGVITINAREKIGFRSEYAGDVRIGSTSFPIFTQDSEVSSTQKDLLSRPELISLIEQTKLGQGESLHFFTGTIGFYLRQPDTGRVTNMIDRVIDLAVAVEIAETAEEKLNLKELPIQFHPLIPLIEKWAVADDSEREDLIDDATDSALKRFTEEVDPYVKAIDSYLDSFRERPPTEEAAALGTLAECALEAKRELSDRNRSRAP